MAYFSLTVDERVELIQPEACHAADLFHLLDQNRDYLKTFLSFVDDITKVEHEEQFIKMMLERQAERTGRLFLIFINGQLQGTIDLHNMDNLHRKAELGYWLSEEYAGQGITTKTVNAVCEFAFQVLDLNKLIILADVENKASNKVALKAGFDFVCTDKEDVMHYGELRDMNRYALLKKDD